jgi:hypothetical protein
VFAVFLGVGITRSITQPLSQLMDASKALGRSEFHHRVFIAGRDELAHLGQVFNETAGTLRDLYEALFTREAYLAEAQRLSHTGSFGWNLPDEELVWSDETFRIFDYDRTVKPTIALVLQRGNDRHYIAGNCGTSTVARSLEPHCFKERTRWTDETF